MIWIKNEKCLNLSKSEVFVFRRCKVTTTFLRAKTIRHRDTIGKYLAENQHKRNS